MKFKKLFLLKILLLSFWFCATSQTIFINEISHLGISKGVEIAGPANSNLTGWSVTIYDEFGNIKSVIPLNATIPDLQNNVGFIWVEVVLGFEGPAGGASLIDDTNQLVQFLSYGNQIKGQEGAVLDQKSELVGTQMTIEDALQLTGAGNTYSNFAWDLPGGFTPDSLNNGQIIINNFGGGGSILPVTWSYFNGSVHSNNVILEWATASEYNNEYFQIEHSVDGKHFQEIGQISSLGNSSEEQKYKFQYQIHDENVGINYYRLVQVDFDGVSSISTVIQVMPSEQLDKIRIFPNPIQADLWIHIPDIPKDILTVEIFNTAGKRLLLETISTNKTTQLNLNTLPKGNYVLIITGNTKPYIQKIIKE